MAFRPIIGCARNRSSCCCTDIVMPEMDGIELARRAAELDPDIKIMFITGFAAVALNADLNAPEAGQGVVKTGPPARTGERSAETACGVASYAAFARSCLAGLEPIDQIALDGRVAQRKSTTLTW